jgi:hypothetical protein
MVSVAIMVEREEEGHVYKVERLVYYISEVMIDSKNTVPACTETNLRPPNLFP